DAVYHYNPDGSLRDEVLTATTTSGLLQSRNVDLNGDGAFDQISVDAVSLNSDGSRTEAVTDCRGTIVTETARTVITTKANGLSRTVQTDRNGDGTFDSTMSDVTALNADGSQVETATAYNGNGSLRAQTITATSADRKTVGITRTVNGALDQIETIVTQAN